MGFVHRGHHSAERIEYQKAKQFCLSHSKHDDLEDEKIFLGTPEDVLNFVAHEVKEVLMWAVPETPRGLVIEDRRGRGAFQKDD